MNQRIRELAQQADIWCDQNVAPDSPAYGIQWEHKFAELIIEECADLFEIDFGESKLTGNEVRYFLNKNFGIEE